MNTHTFIKKNMTFLVTDFRDIFVTKLSIPLYNDNDNDDDTMHFSMYFSVRQSWIKRSWTPIISRQCRIGICFYDLFGKPSCPFLGKTCGVIIIWTTFMDFVSTNWGKCFRGVSNSTDQVRKRKLARVYQTALFLLVLTTLPSDN